MDTGVSDLEVATFKANFTRFNDIGSKDLSNRPIYAVLNTHNLESLRVTGNPRNAMVCDAPYLQNEFSEPRFFFTFLI